MPVAGMGAVLIRQAEPRNRDPFNETVRGPSGSITMAP